MDKLAATLRAGGVALLPTDTVYGLAACPDFPAAVQQIFTLKSRPAGKNLPVFVADASQLAALGALITPRIKKLLHSQWVPGPLTLVMGIAPAIAPTWLAGRTEIAVRLPNAPFLLKLLKITGPLLANKSGQETPASVASILPQLAGTPDITVDDGPRSGTASTIIDCQTTPFTILRRGALSHQALAEIGRI